MTIENNTIEYAFTFGIDLQSTGGPCNNNQILRNTIKYSGYRGINVDAGAAHCNVEGNTVYATGVEHFGEDLMNGPSEGSLHLAVRTPGSTTTGSTARATSACTCTARHATGTSPTTTSPTPAWPCRIPAASIRAASTTGRNKTTSTTISSWMPLGAARWTNRATRDYSVTIETYAGDGSGIYVDEEGNNRIIEHNTVIGSYFAGIFFHWAPSAMSSGTIRCTAIGWPRCTLVGRARTSRRRPRR